MERKLMFVQINVIHINADFFFFFHFTSCGQHETSTFTLLVCFYVLKLFDV